MGWIANTKFSFAIQEIDNKLSELITLLDELKFSNFINSLRCPSLPPPLHGSSTSPPPPLHLPFTTPPPPLSYHWAVSPLLVAQQLI